ncbi:DUF72 domain-containing protein [Microcoleus sp. FACHB-SPT15]|uniref:DUF72 domain-containing protein n=1 Tax=Microcoleus sp. FACHB-SPT15 TaxID=2692830 RepID=UPI00177F314B|nr:DUF72 domain-containing protein [Microcoleus sp. FACHB-SPT15]MBD1809231.1 DUF72 domain-containing protein [Microcoleus sp. FACHB-SPT15]
MSFFIGCAVWGHKSWVGDLYPKGSKAAEFLNLYSQRFTAVEGNTTFYSAPNQETVAQWASQMRPGFELCPKLPRQLTHNGCLQPSISGALEFLEQMQSLGKHLGPIFAQLPPSYEPALLEDLTAFLDAWPRSEAPLAVEVRHPDWFKEPYASNLNTVLEQLGVGRVVLDTRPAYSGSAIYGQQPVEPRKPKVPVQPVVTAPFSLVRFISHPDQKVNQPFMEEWITLVDQWLRLGKRIYFFVHCPIEKYSPGNARHFQQLLEQQGAPVPPLPWNNIEQLPIQLNLF